MIIELFHWSLKDIDETDMESLLQFVTYYPRWKDKQPASGKKEKEVFADQVNWM